VTAWQAFSVDVDGASFTVPRGTRLRGDHPAVLACASYFWKADDGSVEAAPNMWDFVAEPEQPVPEFHRPAPPIPDAEAAECVTTFQVLGGRKVTKGQRLRMDDPLVVENKSYFRTIGKPLEEVS
jgi:hypothetical protein